MSTLINFIAGALLVNIAFFLQLKDYTNLGKKAKLFTISNLGMLSLTLYSFSIGFFTNVLYDLKDSGRIPIFIETEFTQMCIYLILLILAIWFLPSIYAYNIHRMRMADKD